MSKRRTKDFSYFNGYLERHPALGRDAAEGLVHLAGCMGSLMLGAVATVVGLILWQWVGLALFPFGVAAGSMLWLFLYRRHKRRRQPKDEHKLRVDNAMAQFHELRDEKKLHKWVDPIILQLLEAGAYHWTRVATAAESAAWTGIGVPGHMQSIRSQALESAEAAMADMILYGVQCIGKPDKDRRQDVKDMMESFTSLEVIDAVDSLKRIAKSDWREYAFHSPQAPIYFEPMRQIAEKLMTLADEMESMRPQAADPIQAMQGPASTAGIDLLLSEMRAVQAAEDELNQERLRS